MLNDLEQALNEAIQDEYKARATYYLVIKKFGKVRPFVNIVQSEERHIQALIYLFQKYNLTIPVDQWPSRVTVPNSLPEACQQGVQGEIENREMYERLLNLTQDYPDVQRVFLNLQRASQNNHLLAFQRCSNRLETGTFSQPNCQPTQGRHRHRHGRKVTMFNAGNC